MVLILYRYCLGCEIVSAAACHVQKRLSQLSSPTLAFIIFLPLLLKHSLRCDGGVEDLWFKLPIYSWALYRHLSSELWPVVNFYINHHPLHREVSLMKTERCTNLWINMIPCPFSKLVASLLLGPISSPIHGLLVRFTILGMSFFLRIWP